ncbi:hypothetical protein Tco_0201042 [Tanacetum coccineum]
MVLNCFEIFDSAMSRYHFISGSNINIPELAFEKHGMDKCDSIGTLMDTSPKLDVDLSGCLDMCKRTSGEIQFLGDKLVSWSSKKQDCTTMSTAEADQSLPSRATRFSIPALSTLTSDIISSMNRFKGVLLNYTLSELNIN